MSEGNSNLAFEMFDGHPPSTLWRVHCTQTKRGKTVNRVQWFGDENQACEERDRLEEDVESDDVSVVRFTKDAPADDAHWYPL